MSTIGLSLFVFFSCQMNSDSPNDSIDSNWFGLSTAESTSSEPASNYIKFVHKSTPSDSTDSIIELNTAVCEPSETQDTSLKWRLTVHSPFGSQQALIEYPQTNKTIIALVTIENRNLEMVLTDYPTAEDIKFACKTFEDDEKSTVLIDNQFVERVRPWAEEIAPDCRFPEDNLNKFSCTMNTTNPGVALKELVSIKSNMIRRWSRQPYLLARRVAVAQQLAKALLTNSVTKLDAICNVIKFSLAAELPIVMTSTKWSAATCKGEYADRVLAANIGLHKSLEEIQTFKRLFETTAKLGYFTIRIPRTEAPTKTMLVNLTPHSDVKENLLTAISKTWATEYNSELPEFCWHPLFAESSELLYKARYLALANQSGSATCKIAAENKIKLEKIAKTYLADSIASETEFVVSNYRAKLLRLPEGSYDFVIQGLPDDPSQWDDAAEFGPQSTGLISWTKRRPNPIIRKW